MLTTMQWDTAKHGHIEGEGIYLFIYISCSANGIIVGGDLHNAKNERSTYNNTHLEVHTYAYMKTFITCIHLPGITFTKTRNSKHESASITHCYLHDTGLKHSA